MEQKYMVDELYDAVEALYAGEKLEITDFGVCSVDLIIHKDEEYIRKGESYESFIERMVEDFGYSQDDLPEESEFDAGDVEICHLVRIDIKKDGMYICGSNDVHISELYGALERIKDGTVNVLEADDVHFIDDRHQEKTLSTLIEGINNMDDIIQKPVRKPPDKSERD